MPEKYQNFYHVIQCGPSAIGEWIFVLTFLLWVYGAFVSRWIIGIIDVFWPWDSDDLAFVVRWAGVCIISAAFLTTHRYNSAPQAQASKPELVKKLKYSFPKLYAYYGELEAAYKEQSKIIKGSEKELNSLNSEPARRNLQRLIEKAQQNCEAYLQRMSVIEAQASAYYFCKLMREQGKAIDDSAMTEEIQQLESGLKGEMEQQVQ